MRVLPDHRKSWLAPPAVLLCVLIAMGLDPRAASAVGGASRWTLEEGETVEVSGDLAAGGFDHAARTEDGRIQVLVELNDPPAAVIYGEAMRGAAASDRQARAQAGALSKAQVSKIEAAQRGVAGALTSSAIGARELYRVTKALNGIAVAVERDRIPEILKIAGVKRVVPILPEVPTNSTSVPFIGTPNVWANTIGLPAGADGTGMRIGIIDSGIDYLHPAFGGPGATATDYTTERTDTTAFTTVGTATGGSYPTAKVVGGHDFAGDAYTGSNAPAPDPNPMDCGGHGSHVAGSAAAFGMTAGGATFTGPFDANPSTYSGLLIGPGTAPKALLYGLRVFGCFGSTGLTTQAIDWSLDPNGDADLSDHLDVINMSLGSAFGSAVNASALSSDNAALAGVIVVTSAGNSGDTFFISGSPGSGSRVIATAASVDDGIAVATVQVNSPGSIAGGYLAGTASYGSAPSGQTADAVIGLDATTPAATCGTSSTDGCCPLTNAAAMAGKICVVDRGTCGFIVKSLNCQNAGAIGVIVVDNAPGTPPPGLGGTDPSITIPSVRMTLANGTTLKNTITATPPVNVTLSGQSGADTVASFSSRGPRRIFGSPLRLKPDIAAPGQSITSVETGNVCTTATSGSFSCTGVADPSGIQVGVRSLTISGTSMASPHMAGIMALLRQLKPDWSVEELKALAMNYALPSPTFFPAGAPPKFGPSRVGAGRVDPSKSAVGDVIALNAEDEGLVAVTFNPEVAGVTTQVKKVRIVNRGLTSQTYTLAFDNVVDAPGVAFSLPGGSSVTVPAGSSVVIDVQMSADSSQMDHTRDASLFATQGIQANYGDQPRNFLTEEGSYLTFSQGATLKLRVPVYMAERPASMMSAPPTIVTGGAGTGSTTIPLSGTHVCTGTLGAGPTCTGTFPLDVESLVSPFELQVVSPVDPVNSTSYADIQYVGVSFLPGTGSPSLTNDLVLFGMSSWGDWSTLNEVSYNICIDHNEDGVYDKIVNNVSPAIFVAGASLNDNFVRTVRDVPGTTSSILGLASFVNLLGPDVIDSALHLNNVMVLAATPTQLGFTSTADTTFRYKVVTCPATNSSCARTTTGDRCSPAAGTFFDQAAGPFFYNWGAQGLNFGGNFLDEDLNGNSLPVSWNTANMATNGSAGALLLHHHNKAGTRAEVVLLDTAQSSDLAITSSVADALAATLGSNVIYTLTVTNNGPNGASGIVVNAPLPAGVTYVSDDGAGAYSSATGLWTIPGTLASAASATLNLTGTVASTDQQCLQAQITSGTPLDPTPANNLSSVCVLAPTVADLAVTMSVSAPTVLVGQNVTFTIGLTNTGVDQAYSLNVQEAFPAYPLLNPASFVASKGFYDPSTGLWNLASLTPGQSATLDITLAAPSIAGPLTNQSTASSTTSDPDNADNTASATTTVLSPASISATKTVSGSFTEGGAVTYTVVLSNSAAYAQQNNAGSELTDVLPAGLTLVSASATSGTAATAGNTATWDGVVPANGSVTVTIQATVNAGTAFTTISNQGSIAFDADGNGVNEASGQTDDPAVGGATDPTSFFVSSAATVQGTKSASGSFVPGGTVTYTIVLNNSSAQAQLDNPGNELVDVLPTHLVLVSASATSGTAVATIATNTVTWNGQIPGNGSVTITITAQLDSSSGGLTLVNQANINYDADGNGSNEAAGVTDNSALPGATDPTSITVQGTAEIPTLGEIGLVALMTLLAAAALFLLRRRTA